ncbi:hypothetical protein TWF281_006340 [Arthrobotrys megalospora]
MEKDIQFEDSDIMEQIESSAAIADLVNQTGNALSSMILRDQTAAIFDLCPEHIMVFVNGDGTPTSHWDSYAVFASCLRCEEFRFKKHSGQQMNFELTDPTSTLIRSMPNRYPAYNRLLIALEALDLTTQHWNLIRGVKMARNKSAHELPEVEQFEYVVGKYAKDLLPDYMHERCVPLLLKLAQLAADFKLSD